MHGISSYFNQSKRVYFTEGTLTSTVIFWLAASIWFPIKCTVHFNTKLKCILIFYRAAQISFVKKHEQCKENKFSSQSLSNFKCIHRSSIKNRSIDFCVLRDKMQVSWVFFYNVYMATWSFVIIILTNLGFFIIKILVFSW